MKKFNLAKAAVAAGVLCLVGMPRAVSAQGTPFTGGPNANGTAVVHLVPSTATPPLGPATFFIDIFVNITGLQGVCAMGATPRNIVMGAYNLGFPFNHTDFTFDPAMTGAVGCPAAAQFTAPFCSDNLTQVVCNDSNLNAASPTNTDVCVARLTFQANNTNANSLTPIAFGGAFSGTSQLIASCGSGPADFGYSTTTTMINPLPVELQRFQAD